MSISDVTISVWNRFWSPELVSGLGNRNYKIHLIGTSVANASGIRYSRCLFSKLFLKGYFKSGHPWYRKASMEVFEREACFHRLPTRCLWAWSGFNLTMIQWAKKKGIPVVVDTGGAHKAYFWRELEDEHRQWNFSLPENDADARMRKAIAEYELADLIVMPSEFVRQTFIKEGVPENKLVVNPYGVHAEFWADAGINNDRRQNGKLIFIYGAGLTLRKGPHHLVNAWKQAALADAELWICGGGDLPLERLCEGIPENVKLLGFKTHEQMRELYRQAHVYVLPSMMEGLARSCIEAMAAGLPLIVTRETGVTDIMTDGVEGWIVPCRNPEALKERLVWCAGNKQAVAAAGVQAHLAGTKYSFEAYGSRSADILKSLIGH